MRALDKEGNALEAPREWTPGFVEVDVPVERWQEARLESGGREMPLSLRLLGGAQRVVAEWPKSGTGHYELHLSLPDAPTECLTWTVQPTKISFDAYLEMLEALERRLPVSIALGLQRLGALTGLRFEDPAESTLAQELARLRRAVEGSAGRPGLSKILPAVARDPHRVLSDTEVWVPRSRARRVNPSRLPHVLTGGSNLDQERLPLKLPEARVEESTDVYENRLLASFHEQTERRLHRLRGAAQKGRSKSLLEECDSLMGQLAKGRREARFLDGVGRLEHRPDRLTMVLLKRPEYRYAMEGYLELHRSAVAQLDEPDLEAPLEKLPALYQTWGALEVLDVLLEVAAEEGFKERLQRVVRREPSGVFVRVLRGGRPAVTARRSSDGTEVRLLPQRSYMPSASGYQSVSYKQIPDVAIEVERPGEPGKVFLFDPKYKLDSEVADEESRRPQKVDIDAMHAYRDAIRDDSGERVVEFAAILYPGPDKQFGAGLGALSALPDKEEELRGALREVLGKALAAR